MKTVIFGAGASYDCVKEFNQGFGEDRRLNYRPPLTRDLFQLIPWYEELQRSYPGVQALLARLRSVADVEAFLQEKWSFAEQHDDKVLGANLINMQFYLQHVLFKCSAEYGQAGPSNYDDIVARAHEFVTQSKSQVLLVSFNYDLLLENAIRKWYYRLSSHLDIDDYISSPIKLIKPHGSCNWYRRLRTNFISGNGTVSHLLYQSNVDLKSISAALEGDFIAEPTIRNGLLAGPNALLLFPQIIIPLKTKDELVLPAKHHNSLIEGLEKTTDLLVIGWKGQEEKFLALLEEHLKDRIVAVTLVCRGSGSVVKETLKKRLPLATIEIFDLAVEKRIGGGSFGPEYEVVKDGGSFSSYIWNVDKGQWPDFFAA